MYSTTDIRIRSKQRVVNPYNPISASYDDFVINARVTHTPERRGNFVRIASLELKKMKNGGLAVFHMSFSCANYHLLHYTGA